MKKQLKCDMFICSDPSSCPEHCNGLCSGKYNDGFINCGCDACSNQKIIGPYITCKKADEFEYKKDIENTPDYDYDDECFDYIINP
ncbi:MAG: hypothetical protein J6R47_04200 [Acholeplasmatales bacterium]|nr:hypothetical protein [Acholeplasmatales bacterium]